MKRLIVAATALMGLSLAVQAQVWGGGGYGRRNDPYYGNARYGNNAAPVNRAISDLERMRGGWFNSDRKNIDKAISELTKFQDKMYRQGRFDTGHLDKAISHMQKVANNSHRLFGGGQRNTIFRDLDELRAFRSSGGAYGYNNGGYGPYDRGGYDPNGYPTRGRYPYP